MPVSKVVANNSTVYVVTALGVKEFEESHIPRSLSARGGVFAEVIVDRWNMLRVPLEGHVQRCRSPFTVFPVRIRDGFLSTEPDVQHKTIKRGGRCERDLSRQKMDFCDER